MTRRTSGAAHQFSTLPSSVRSVDFCSHIWNTSVVTKAVTGFQGGAPCLWTICMKIIGKKKLFAFIKKHVDAREWIENWIKDVEGCRWRLPQDVKDRYATASFLADRVVIFNVRGNHYRLETQIAYQVGTVAVKWAGTHAEYTQRYK